jgi:hypothetical protein
MQESTRTQQFGYELILEFVGQRSSRTQECGYYFTLDFERSTRTQEKSELVPDRLTRTQESAFLSILSIDVETII